MITVIPVTLMAKLSESESSTAESYKNSALTRASPPRTSNGIGCVIFTVESFAFSMVIFLVSCPIMLRSGASAMTFKVPVTLSAPVFSTSIFPVNVSPGWALTLYRVTLTSTECPMIFTFLIT